MSTRDAIRAIQTGLRDLNHAPGPIDGFFGGATRAATERWLDANGQPAAATTAPKAIRPLGEIRQGRAGYLVDEIIVHCSATPPSWMANRSFEEQVAEIRRWHVQDNGWSDIGYAWLISRDGRILPGRAETRIGAHVVNRNRGTLGLCLIGGGSASATDTFGMHFTDQQKASLIFKIREISSRTPIKTISGHNQYAAKGCPGFNVPGWLETVDL